MYGHSWVVIHYDDLSIGEFCSLHCVSIDMSLNTNKTAITILVGDYFTKKLIDADKAFWVVGGSQMGVMTTRAKWAFKEQQDAERSLSYRAGQQSFRLSKCANQSCNRLCRHELIHIESLQAILRTEEESC